MSLQLADVLEGFWGYALKILKLNASDKAELKNRQKFLC